MEFLFTNGTNRDFVFLCGRLDEFLNETVGGEKQRKQYIQYNTLEHIHDVVLAYEDSVPMGCAAFKEYGPGVAEVKRVFLREEYRGTGTARQMISLVEQRAKEKGYVRLILETGVPLAAAVKLYQRMGYQRIENYGQYRDMKDSICMAKDI
ncbi:MAG TPA: GNAT family N-acetyltransferase [Caproiciproducens sp.]|nr:GNAT family N-acetyltransferase [Caproiciproducens sp.]